jgi:hypothetical protein
MDEDVHRQARERKNWNGITAIESLPPQFQKKGKGIFHHHWCGKGVSYGDLVIAIDLVHRKRPSFTTMQVGRAKPSILFPPTCLPFHCVVPWPRQHTVNQT